MLDSAAAGGTRSTDTCHRDVVVVCSCGSSVGVTIVHGTHLSPSGAKRSLCKEARGLLGHRDSAPTLGSHPLVDTILVAPEVGVARDETERARLAGYLAVGLDRVRVDRLPVIPCSCKAKLVVSS